MLEGASMFALLRLYFFNFPGKPIHLNLLVVFVEGRVLSLFEIHDSSE